jgi:glycosyltransferase involved in cell wall biosynthesis/GT2 family glycosyltransferase
MIPEKARILFVYQFLGLGGVEVVLQSRIAALADAGVDVRALFLEGGSGESLMTGLRDRITVTGDPAAWATLLEQFRPDWVLAIDTPQVLGTVRKNAPGSRIVYEVHTPYPAAQRPLVDKDALAGVKAIFVPSPSQRELVRALSRDCFPVYVVPNALPAVFSPPAGGASLTPVRPVIGWVGRLDAVKNWRAFVETAAELRELDVQFWMVGGAESSSVQRHAFESAVREARLEEMLTWSSSVPYAEMPAFYGALAASGGALLSTSWAESFGMTALEAAACACPVVAPDVVGLRDLVVHQKTGLVYPSGDSRAAAGAVRTLLESQSLRSGVIAGATQQLAAFTPAAAAAALLDALAAAAATPSRGRPHAGQSLQPAAAKQSELIDAASDALAEIEHRDHQIRDLQAELFEKVASRDEIILALQNEVRDKVDSRDKTILGLQREMEEKVAARDDLVRQLQQELHEKVGAANRAIEGLQADLTSAQLGASRAASEQQRQMLETEARHRHELLSRDEQLLAVRGEMQAAVADLQTQLRDGAAAGREQQMLFEMRIREAQIDHERALLEAEKELAASVARRQAEVLMLRDELTALREELSRAPSAADLTARDAEILRLSGIVEEAEKARTRVAAALTAARQRIGELDAAVASECAGREASEDLAATLRREHEQLHTEAAALRDDLAAARLALTDQETLTDEIRESLRGEASAVRLRLSNTQFELGMTRQELLAIYRSRLWKLGSAYWRSLKALGRLPRVSGTSTHDGWQHLPVACPSCGDTIKLLDLLMAAPAPEEELAARPAPLPESGNVVALFPEAPVAPLAAEYRHDVICFPIIDWDFRFQRPQQLMVRYARAGHRVFYISQRFRPSGRPFEIRRVTESVYEVSLRAPKKNVYSSTMSRKELDEFFASLNALRKEAGIHAAAAIVQLPFWRALAQRAREEFAWPLIYDCMDHHHGFSGTTRETVHEEKKLMRGADLVVVSSAYLEREARRHTDKVVVVRNGCDYEHFAAIAPKPRMARPVIGYYGAIADWFDSDLVADLAERRPDWDFVLVGSSHLADLKRLEALPNVRLTGEKAYAEVPEWLASFDIAIIPFKRTPLTEATNPVKCYEMLAGGKPVVAVPIPEVSQLAPFVRLASTAAEFEREIITALAEDSDEAAEERQRFARANTWDARLQTMAPAITETFPKASIVIVTFNSLDLNRQCLRTLYERTEWPRFEVFVVDNASQDGTAEFLREAEQAYPNLKVILNSTNAGFPAANNQALKQSTGDYVVLLNNDTVSARGWLSTLIRHLHRDPKIGLIGPSTNAIGNEGMVQVGYRDVADMPSWAAQFVRQHDGEVFDIPMLAMFCVATRRSTFDRVGLLDEKFGMGMFEDDDYSQRVRELKLRVVCARDSFVHHWMRAAFSKVPQAEYDAVFAQNRTYFEKKWGRPWQPHQQAGN